jgi:SAM-dependent methyltransferase
MIKTILEKVEELKPRVVLDVGCREGKYTIKAAPHCGHITAIDINPKAIEKAKSENPGSNINYLCMDGRRIGFPDDNFDLVYERVTLHHVKEWETALDEMIRVSSRHILIEEPLDDLRSAEKENSYRGQQLYLQIQQEQGFSHFNYLKLEDFFEYFRSRKIKIEFEITGNDELESFDQFFDQFSLFLEKSDRRKYWTDRLNAFREEMKGQSFCKSDLLFIMTNKYI